MIYNTALECCKANREEIIEVYNEEENRPFTLKEFMEVVLSEMEKVAATSGRVVYGDLVSSYDDMLKMAMAVSSAKRQERNYNHIQRMKRYL